MKFIVYTHYSPLLHGSGGEKYLQGLLEKLVAKGDECICWCREDENKPKTVNGVRYIHELLEKRSFEDFVKKEKPDFIITQFHSSTYAINLAHSLGIKIVYIAHNDMEISTKKEIQLLNETDVCVFNTIWIYKKLSSFTRARSCVVHPSVKIYDIIPQLNRKYITFVNPMKSKGADIFYRTALMMKDKQFLVVKGGYGKQEIQYKKNVKFIENTQNMLKDVYSQTRILFAPSLYETYGMVAAEASSLGIPCVVSKTAGFKECLGDAGILVNSLKAADWVAELRKFDDEAYYQKYSQRARQRMIEERDKPYFEDFYSIVEFLGNKHF